MKKKQLLLQQSKKYLPPDQPPPKATTYEKLCLKEDKVPDLLDFFITSKVSADFIKIEENFDLRGDFDRSAAIRMLSEIIIKQELDPHQCTKLPIGKDLKQTFKELKTLIQLGEEADKLATLIQTTAYNNAKKISHDTNRIIQRTYIRKMVREKRNAKP